MLKQLGIIALWTITAALACAPSPARIPTPVPMSYAVVDHGNEAFELLLRNDQVAGPQPFIPPSSNANAWDFGGPGSNTAQNWVNWNGINGITQQRGDHQSPSTARR